jgi:hypothetical protein
MALNLVCAHTTPYQGFLFRLQNDGGINSDWCISGGNHSYLLGKGVCSLKETLLPTGG